MSARRLQKIILLGITGVIFGGFIVVAARHYWPLGQATLEVSREITYLTEPLHPDGTVDYFSVVREELSKGVTRENNAAVLLLRALGPDVLSLTLRDEALRELGLESLTDEGAYFVPYNEFLLSGGDAKSRRESVDMAAKQVLASTRAPWTRKDHARLADWIDASAPALDLLVEASSREHLYFPIFSLFKPARYSEMEPALRLVPLRLAGQALASRALLRAGSGAMRAAWADVVAIFRLARLVQRGPRRIETTMGLGMEVESMDVAKSILASTDVPPAIAEEALRELKATRDAPPLSRHARLTRFLILDMHQSFWSERRTPAGVEDLEEVDGDHIDPAALVVVNRVLDEVEGAFEAASLPERIERAKALKTAHDKSFEESNARALSSWFRALASASDRRYEFTERLLHLSLTALLPAIPSIVYVRGRADIETRLVRIGLHLEIHRDQTGEYPESLDALPLELIDDPFVDGPLSYRRESVGYTLLSVGFDGVEGRDRVGRGLDRDVILKKPATTDSTPAD